MDTHNPNTGSDDSWLDDLLSAPEHGDELLPDENAISSAGLTHPSDAELDQILREVHEQDWSAPDEPQPSQAESESPAEPFRDDEYRDTFGEGDALEKVFSDEPMVPSDDGAVPPPPTEDGPDADLPKRRPRHKKGYGFLGIPHVLVTLVWAAIVLAIGITLGRMAWLCVADVLAFGRPDQQVTLTIDREDTVDSIAQKLKKAGLIQYPDLFKFYVDFSHKADSISPGTFELNAKLDYMALVNSMHTDSESRKVVQVVIPEGYSCAQIFQLLSENQVCSVQELEDWAANGEISDYWFLKDVKRGSKYCLEGFLFPDTYQFYTDDEPQRVLEKFLDNFEYRFNDELRSSIDELNSRLSQMMADNGYDESYIQAHQMTVYEVITVASMIEKETANTLESYTISSVIYNRLTNQAEYPYLNIDATIVYALGGKTTALTMADLQVDSPYNTYTNPGLTPGPIANPGLYSINAALDPDDTDYYFYAMDPSTGSHHFSESSAEHDAFLAGLEDGE